MKTAKIIETDKNQAVTLPKEYKFSVDEIIVQLIGSSLILSPEGQSIR